MVISGEEQLQAFREQWNGSKIIELVKQSKDGVLINWLVGVGKSTNIDGVIEDAISKNEYELVIALFPTRRVIDERRWVQCPPPNIKIVNLKPRPRRRCGSAADATWTRYEVADSAMLGRAEICGVCRHRKRCPWPTQYGKGMEGARVVFATQSHLTRSPGFIQQIIRWVGVTRVLVVLDEVGFAAASFRKTIGMNDVRRYVGTLKAMSPSWERDNKRPLYLADLLLSAATVDLQGPGWKPPMFSTDWALAVQMKGKDLYGNDFRFLAYDLQQFGTSPVESRERCSDGNIAFASPPYVGCDLIVYSGTGHPEFVEYRLGRKISNPFAEYVFKHQNTTWFNIASRLGARKYFHGNAPQILDFFAQLVARRLKEGRRPLLIAKKCFVGFCATEMEKRLREFGIADAKVVYGNWDKENLTTAGVVPLINYGMIGTNLFEDFDCAYCLTGFYVNETVVNSILQDGLASNSRLQIKITTAGRPRRRSAGTLYPDQRSFDIHKLAQLALNQQEMDRVIQAVGRVRPFTRAREVVTFQCAANPLFPYTCEFNTLAEARGHFGIQDRRERGRHETAARVGAARAAGFTQHKAASVLNVSLSTVKRYWNSEKVSSTL